MLADTRAARLAGEDGVNGVLTVGDGGAGGNGREQGEAVVPGGPGGGRETGEAAVPSVAVDALVEVLKENVVGFRRARERIVDGEVGSGGASTARLGGELVSFSGGGGGTEGGNKDKPDREGLALGQGGPGTAGEGGKLGTAGEGG